MWKCCSDKENTLDPELFFCFTEVSNPSLPRKAEKQEEVKGEGEEIVRNSFDSIRSLQIHSSDPDHSREPSLGYLAADNPAYRNRLSLDALPEYDLACW